VDKPLLVGAVSYTPNVVSIWEGIRDYFAGLSAEMDFVLFSNYGRQVDALIDGTIDLAWNTNLAWVRTVAQTDGQCRAVAMRDTDTVFKTILVTRAGGGLDGPEALRGRRVALGSKDSAQAAILPVHYLDTLARGRMPWSSYAPTPTSASTVTPGAASWTRCGRCWTTAPTRPRLASTPGRRSAARS